MTLLACEAENRVTISWGQPNSSGLGKAGLIVLDLVVGGVCKVNFNPDCGYKNIVYD